MQASQIPVKFPVPFANAAGSGFIRQVPAASQIGITNGAASLNDGFPPVTFQPVGAGGTPPSGQDFNGLLNQSTSWDRWFSAGAPIYYDATFSENIGGYPLGAVLSAAGNLGNFWLSLVDNNTSDPDTGGANWQGFSTATSASLVHQGTDTGTVNTIVANVSPPINAYQIGTEFNIKIAHSNTGAATANLGPGVLTVTRPDGTALINGDYVQGQEARFVFDGTNLQLSALAPQAFVQTPQSAASVTASLVLATQQSYTSNTYTTINFTAAATLPAFCTLASGIVTITKPGIYFFSGTVSAFAELPSGETQYSSLIIYKNGALLTQTTIDQISFGEVAIAMNVGMPTYCAVGDQINFVFYSHAQSYDDTGDLMYANSTLANVVFIA